MKHLLVFVLATAITNFAQEKATATQIDEFSRVTCEELLARVDNFQIQLQNNPTAIGLVVIDSPQNGKDRSPFYRLLIQKTFHRNGYAFERLQFYRRKTAELGGSMWLMPPGTDVPFPDAEPWPDTLLDLSQAFIWDSFDYDDVCPTFAPREYGRLIKSNQEIRGQIVVHAGSRCDALATGTDWIKELTERWGIPTNRLRLFIGKRNKIWSSTDFWIVPAKRK